jgi:hypothetical protein
MCNATDDRLIEDTTMEISRQENGKCITYKSEVEMIWRKGLLLYTPDSYEIVCDN